MKFEENPCIGKNQVNNIKRTIVELITKGILYISFELAVCQSNAFDVKGKYIDLF